MEPPIHLTEQAQAVWLEITKTYGSGAEDILGPELDAYCGHIAILREAQRRVLVEGQVIADPRGVPMKHPSLEIAKAAQQEIDRLAPKFRPKRKLRRRSGPMYDATCTAIAAAEHLAEHREFEGTIAAAKTLAWVVDEAQRDGLKSLQAAAAVALPTYLKACAALRITPAAAPAVAAAPEKEEKRAKRTSSMRVMKMGGAA